MQELPSIQEKGHRFGVSVTKPCTAEDEKKRGPKCKSCPLMSRLSVVKNNKCEVKASAGDCNSSNVIYAAQCTICTHNNTYVGKTVAELRQRINGHRSAFYSVLKAHKKGKWKATDIDDANCLGAHLINFHEASSEDDFDNFYKFTILKSTDPSNLRYVEQSLIESLNTHVPFGLNNINSIFSGF